MNKKVLSVSKITGIINLLISVFVFVDVNTFLHPCSAEIVRNVLNEYANNDHILIVSTHDSLLAAQARKSLYMSY